MFFKRYKIGINFLYLVKGGRRREEGDFFWFGLVWVGVMICRYWNWIVKVDRYTILYCTVLYVWILLCWINQSDSRFHTFFPTIREAGVVSSTK